MERNNLKNYHTIGGRSMKEPINIINKNNHNVRNSWEYCTSHDNYQNGDLLSGYLWNPRSYACSFCKREFRSAQALGGHMNVHRRDRARLRQYSPPNLNPNPNPNPSINLNLSPNDIPNSNQHTTTSYSSKCTSRSLNYYHSTTLPPIEVKNWVTESSPSHYQSEVDLEKIKYSKALFKMGSLDGFRNENVCGALKNAQVVRLDLEIGLITHGKEAVDLDLELRLGR